VNITADDDGTLHAFVVENSPGNRSRTPLYMGEDLNAALVATNEAITQFTHLGFRDYESGDAVEARRFDFQQSAKELHISDRQGVGALNKPRRPSAPAWRD
jgi:hypothetical protein